MVRFPSLLNLLAASAVLSGCALRPSVARESQPVIMIKSVRLPVRSWLPWFARFAEHTWIDFRYASTWHRIEWDNIDHLRTYEMHDEQAFADHRWDRDVAVHDQFTGAWAEEVATKILPTAANYPHFKDYLPWPGPNSNSFVEWIAQELDLPIVLPPNAVGKDYTTWLHAGITSSRTGIELETMLLGLQVGLREGIEAHLLGLTLGASLWPPSIKLPFLPSIPTGWFPP